MNQRIILLDPHDPGHQPIIIWHVGHEHSQRPNGQWEIVFVAKIAGEFYAVELVGDTEEEVLHPDAVELAQQVFQKTANVLRDQRRDHKFLHHHTPIMPAHQTLQ